MRLVRLGQGRWTVYAACRADGSCPLYEFVRDLDGRRARRVLAALQDYVPWTEPAAWARSEFAKRLARSDGIFEFRWPTRSGGTPRVFWFYDEGRVIICSHGLDKKGAMSPQETGLAEQIRREYLAAKSAGRLEMVAPGNWNRP